MNSFVLRSILLVGASVIAVPAVAQEASQRTSAPEPTDEIIVTAQRRDESLSRTPVAVVVIGGEKLAEAQINTESDLRVATPGLQVRTGTSSNQVNYSMRGQSQDPFSDSRPGVLPYVNEVQISSFAGTTTFYDLKSIQVLKGPQGTLFGRSATGGALLFTTATPTDEFGGYVSALAGNYNAHKIEGAVNVPLIQDKVAARIAGFYRDRDGFQKNLFKNRREGAQEQFGLRGSLKLTPGSGIENDLMVEYFQSDSENTLAVPTGLLPFTGVGAPFVPAELLYAGTGGPTATITGQCTLQAFAGLGPCPPVDPAVAGFYAAYFSDPERAKGLTQLIAEQKARGPFTIEADGENTYKTRNIVITNTTQIDIGENAKIKNIFGYVHARSFFQFECDGTIYALCQSSLPNGDTGYRPRIGQISDEIQLVGKALDSQLDYVVGGYFSDESNKTFRTTQFFDILFGGVAQDNATRVSNRTLAGYAQATYRFGDTGLGVTGGLRYTDERVRKETLPGDANRVVLGTPAPNGYSYDKKRSFNNLSWTLGLQYQADPSLLLYAVSRRAYKSGGFNATVVPFNGSAAEGGDLYDSERVTDGELGVKYSGRAGTMPTRLALAIYKNWIRNGQRAGFGVANGNVASLTVNVPKATTQGVEFNGEVKPSSWLTLGGDFAYTDAKFTDGTVSVIGTPQVYDQVPDAPKYAASAYTDIRVPMTQALNLLAHADIYHQSATTTSPRSVNSAGTGISAYTLANFRLGVEDADNRWSLIANLKNAFNKVYYAGGLQAGEVFQINTLIPAEPRTFTVEARYNF